MPLDYRQFLGPITTRPGGSLERSAANIINARQLRDQRDQFAQEQALAVEQEKRQREAMLARKAYNEGLLADKAVGRSFDQNKFETGQENYLNEERLKLIQRFTESGGDPRVLEGLKPGLDTYGVELQPGDGQPAPQAQPDPAVARTVRGIAGLPPPGTEPPPEARAPLVAAPEAPVTPSEELSQQLDAAHQESLQGIAEGGTEVNPYSNKAVARPSVDEQYNQWVELESHASQLRTALGQGGFDTGRVPSTEQLNAWREQGIDPKEARAQINAAYKEAQDTKLPQGDAAPMTPELQAQFEQEIAAEEARDAEQRTAEERELAQTPSGPAARPTTVQQAAPAPSIAEAPPMPGVPSSYQLRLGSGPPIQLDANKIREGGIPATTDRMLEQYKQGMANARSEDVAAVEMAQGILRNNPYIKPETAMRMAQDFVNATANRNSQEKRAAMNASALGGGIANLDLNEYRADSSGLKSFLQAQEVNAGLTQNRTLREGLDKLEPDAGGNVNRRIAAQIYYDLAKSATGGGGHGLSDADFSRSTVGASLFQRVQNKLREEFTGEITQEEANALRGVLAQLKDISDSRVVAGHAAAKAWLDANATISPLAQKKLERDADGIFSSAQRDLGLPSFSSGKSKGSGSGPKKSVLDSLDEVTLE